MAKTDKRPPSQEEYDKELLDLGKKLRDFYDTGYISKKRTLLWSFLKGVASGFGALIGSTIVIALLLWALSFFKELPFVHSINQALQSAVQKK